MSDYSKFAPGDRMESIVMGKAYGEQGTIVSKSPRQDGMPITDYIVEMDNGETIHFSIYEMKWLPPATDPDAGQGESNP